MRRRLTTLGGKKSSETAYRMAGLKPKDMQFAQIYDCFTITAMITLEDYGFCKKGEGKDFVKNGRITHRRRTAAQYPRRLVIASPS